MINELLTSESVKDREGYSLRRPSTDSTNTLQLSTIDGHSGTNESVYHGRSSSLPFGSKQRSSSASSGTYHESKQQQQPPPPSLFPSTYKSRRKGSNTSLPYCTVLLIHIQILKTIYQRR